MLKEIMVIREDGLKIFKMDDDTLAKLRRIRGNLYADDPRLRTVADMPTVTQSQTPDIDPERKAWLAGAYAKCLANQAAKATPAAIQPQPMTFEDQIKHDWRFNPGIRKEFVSLASYEAFMRAQKAGRVRVCGGVS